MGKLTSNICLVVITFLCFLYVSGLRVDQAESAVKSIFRGRTYRRYFEENVVNVSSWNVRGHDAKDICSYVRRVKPKVMGFQDVTKSKAKEIFKCLKLFDYNYYLGESDGSRYELYNPIFYQDTRYFKVRKSGTFWLSNTSSVKGSSLMDGKNRATTPRVCTWVKISFAQRRNVPRMRISKIRKILLNRLHAFIGRSTPKRRTFVVGKYIWSSAYVANTKLESRNEDVAKRQMKIFENHIRYDPSAMDRRRYPFIFMADLGWNYKSEVYNEIAASEWLIDSMKYSARTFGMRTNYRNFIMRYGLKSLMSATLSFSRSQNHPVFAAYLSERSPKRKEIDYGMRNIVTGGK